jgi:hypothetical protein
MKVVSRIIQSRCIGIGNYPRSGGGFDTHRKAGTPELALEFISVIYEKEFCERKESI